MKIYEVDENIEKLIKYAVAAGLSAFAIKKAVQKYKREKALGKFGKTTKRLDREDAYDIMTGLGEAPWNFRGGS